MDNIFDEWLSAFAPTDHAAEDKVKTQKAKGVLYLAQRAGSGLGKFMSTIPVFSPTMFKDQDGSSLYYHQNIYVLPHEKAPGPGFYRPCPMRPRHGFVDSTWCPSRADAEHLLERTLAADPEGEVLVMPKLNGAYGAVANHATVTWGTPSYAVTNGLGQIWKIPAYTDPEVWDRAVLGDLPGWNPGAMAMQRERIGIKNTIYLEAITDAGGFETWAPGANKTYAVQLRDGPVSFCSQSYIPEECVATKVLTPTSGKLRNLLKWEGVVAGLKRKQRYRGGLLYTPVVVLGHNGASLNSHAAVQCIVNNIPVLCVPTEWGGEPVVESMALIPEKEDKVEVPTCADLERTAYLIRLFLTNLAGTLDMDELDTSDQGELCRLAIATFHACPQWPWNEDLFRLRALGLAATLRFLMSACIGEARHFGGGIDKPGPSGEESDLNWEELIGTPARLRLRNGNALPRDVVYDGALTQEYGIVATACVAAFSNFHDHVWSNSSYGGNAWAYVTSCTIVLAQATRRFSEEPTLENWQTVLGCWNKAVNACHNSSTVLTKWVRTPIMDVLAMVPGLGFLTSRVPVILSKHKLSFVEPLANGAFDWGIPATFPLPHVIPGRSAETLPDDEEWVGDEDEDYEDVAGDPEADEADALVDGDEDPAGISGMFVSPGFKPLHGELISKEQKHLKTCAPKFTNVEGIDF